MSCANSITAVRCCCFNGQPLHVRLQQVQGTAVDITFSGDRSAQAALVGACVAAGHALVSVSSVTENLQQSYLKSLAAERAPATAQRMQA